MSNFLSSPTLKLILALVGVAAGAVAAYQPAPATVKAVAGAVAAVISTLLGGIGYQTNVQLRRARAEADELRAAMKGGKK
jgi:di/tricarboxylate transporter